MIFYFVGDSSPLKGFGMTEDLSKRRTVIPSPERARNPLQVTITFLYVQSLLRLFLSR